MRVRKGWFENLRPLIALAYLKEHGPRAVAMLTWTDVTAGLEAHPTKVQSTTLQAVLRHDLLRPVRQAAPRQTQPGRCRSARRGGSRDGSLPRW